MKIIRFFTQASCILWFGFLVGCSPVVKEKLLRTFFDGVPPAGEKKAPAETKQREQTAKEAKPEIVVRTETQFFFHAPFSENQCDSCHDTKYSQKLTSEGKDLCFNCHDDFTKDKKIVHYPIKEGSCLDCHDPHQSVNKFLLKQAIPQICYACHDEKEIADNPLHEGQTMCTDCHQPHVSNEEKLLK